MPRVRGRILSRGERMVRAARARRIAWRTTEAVLRKQLAAEKKRAARAQA